MFKNFFKNHCNLKIFIAILVTLVSCWIADTHNDWNFDMMLKEVNTIFVILVSLGIVPFTMYKKWKGKIDKEAENLKKTSDKIKKVATDKPIKKVLTKKKPKIKDK